MNIKKIMKVEKEKQSEMAPVAAPEANVEEDVVKGEVAEAVAQVEPEQHMENADRPEEEEIRAAAKNCAPPEKQEV